MDWVSEQRVAERAMKSSAVEGLKSVIPDEWLHEQTCVKDG